MTIPVWSSEYIICIVSSMFTVIFAWMWIMLVSLKLKFIVLAKSLTSFVPFAVHNTAIPNSSLNKSCISFTGGAFPSNLTSIICKCICLVGTLIALTNNGESLPRYDLTSSAWCGLCASSIVSITSLSICSMSAERLTNVTSNRLIFELYFFLNGCRIFPIPVTLQLPCITCFFSNASV